MDQPLATKLTNSLINKKETITPYRKSISDW